MTSKPMEVEKIAVSKKLSFSLKLRRWARILVALVCCVALLASICKTIGLFPEGLAQTESLLGGDKWLHYWVAFTITLGVYFAFVSCRRKQSGPGEFGAMLLLINAFTLDEVLQLAFPRREFSVADLIVNYWGVFSAWLVWRWYKKVKRSRG